MKPGKSSVFPLCLLFFFILLPAFATVARNPVSISERINDDGGVVVEDYAPPGPNPCHDPLHPSCDHPSPPSQSPLPNTTSSTVT